jgi:uncharacterized damage-inducible protein DinB
MSEEQQTLAGLVRYSAWASKKLLEFASAVPEDALAGVSPNSHGGVLKTFQHIYYADRVWLLRLQQAAIHGFEDPPPGPSFPQLGQVWPPLLDRLAAWVETAEPDAVIPFKFFSGEAFTLNVRQIVHHVVNHGTYHRGQIAAMLRQCGHKPPSTDLLFYHLKM